MKHPIRHVTFLLTGVMALALPSASRSVGCSVARPSTSGLDLFGASSSAHLGARNGLAAGDLNGDGRLDLVVAAPDEDALSGVVRVMFRELPSSPFGPVDLATNASDADPFNDIDVEIRGRAGDRLGSSVACGDMSGDGTADLVIGSVGTPPSPGEVLVFFGPFCAGDVIDLALRSPDVVVTSAVVTGLGHAVRVADVGEDGRVDLIAGAPASNGPGGTRPGAGAVIVLAGPFSPGARFDPAGGGAVLIHGAAAGDAVGWAVDAGDVSGDGFADLVAGAPGADDAAGGVDAGRVEAFFGPLPAAVTIDLASTDADVSVRGADPSFALGGSVLVAELSGDCAPDLIASASPPPHEGHVLAFFGPLAPGVLDLSHESPSWRVRGLDHDHLFGAALASGEWTGDGQDDLLIGSPGWQDSPTRPTRIRDGIRVGLSGPLLEGFDAAWDSYTNGRSGRQSIGLGGSFAHAAMGTSVLAADLFGDALSDLVGGEPGAPAVVPTDVEAGGVDAYPVEDSADPGACTPRTHGFWHRQCLSLAAPEGLDPGRRRNVPGEQAISAVQMRELLGIVNHLLCGVTASACDALQPSPSDGARGRAMRAVTALLLNQAAGFLGDSATLAPPGFPMMMGIEASRLSRELLAAGDWTTAEQLALRINSDAACHRAARGRRR